MQHQEAASTVKEAPVGSGGKWQGWLVLALLIGAAHWIELSLLPPSLLLAADDLQQYQQQEAAAANSVEAWDAAPWRLIGVFKKVETFVKKVPRSHLHAMRGVATLDLHISDAMAHFYDVRLAKEWIDMLAEIKELSWPPPALPSATDSPTDIALSEKNAAKNEQEFLRAKSKMNHHPLSENLEYVDAVYEIMRLPWPMAPRDILLQRNWHYDFSNKTVTIRYHSFDDPVRCPESPSRIRAISPHTQWKFSVVPSNSKSKGTVPSSATRVEIECLVDSKGSLPAWFINYFQRSFPSDSLSAFNVLALQKKVPPHKRVVHW